MSIIDYEKRCKNLLDNLLKDSTITQANKDALVDFLDTYAAKPARRSIFIENVLRFLRHTPDIRRDMHEAKKIDKIINLLSQKYSPATIETIKIAVKTFTTKLNDGKKPEGIVNLKKDKNAFVRNLKPSDMITWEEGLKIAEQTSSIQFKAIFLTQLDCGFRPSEFIELNYGDVSIDGDIVIFHVKGGKTGQRDVWMQRAAPQFLRWYHTHPHKRKDAPLWIMESVRRSHRKEGLTPTNSRYSYPALLSRVELMFEKAEIDKPDDFYNLRHSSCVLDKMDNLPNDLAAQRHGHSVDFFINVYGRLDLKGVVSRVRKHYGTEAEKQKPLTNIVCQRCKTLNEPKNEYCLECGFPLSSSASAKMYEEKKKNDDRLERMENMLLALANSDDRFKKAAKMEKMKK